VSPESGEDIWFAPLDDPSAAQKLIATEAAESRPLVSPASDLLLYNSDRSGRDEIYLQGFPEGSGHWQVSNNGGADPTWSAGGRRIYYLQDEISLMEVEVGVDGGVRLSNPRQLFVTASGGLGLVHGYDVAPGNDRFVTVQTGSTDVTGGDLTLVIGWDPESNRSH
jgi:hypothetical protein